MAAIHGACACLTLMMAAVANGQNPGDLNPVSHLIHCLAGLVSLGHASLFVAECCPSYRAKEGFEQHMHNQQRLSMRQSLHCQGSNLPSPAHRLQPHQQSARHTGVGR